LRATGANLPHLVVLELGTNGGVTQDQVDAALSILGPDRILVLVTPHHGDTPSAAQDVRDAAARHPDRVLLLDWDLLAMGHPEWFAPDGIHLGGSAGINAFA